MAAAQEDRQLTGGGCWPAAAHMGLATGRHCLLPAEKEGIQFPKWPVGAPDSATAFFFSAWPQTADPHHAPLPQGVPGYRGGPAAPSQALGRQPLPPSSLNLPGSRAPACVLACVRACLRACVRAHTEGRPVLRCGWSPLQGGLGA